MEALRGGICVEASAWRRLPRRPPELCPARLWIISTCQHRGRSTCSVNAPESLNEGRDQGAGLDSGSSSGEGLPRKRDLHTLHRLGAGRTEE